MAQVVGKVLEGWRWTGRHAGDEQVAPGEQMKDDGFACKMTQRARCLGSGLAEAGTAMTTTGALPAHHQRVAILPRPIKRTLPGS